MKIHLFWHHITKRPIYLEQYWWGKAQSIPVPIVIPHTDPLLKVDLWPAKNFDGEYIYIYICFNAVINQHHWASPCSYHWSSHLLFQSLTESQSITAIYGHDTRWRLRWFRAFGPPLSQDTHPALRDASRVFAPRGAQRGWFFLGKCSDPEGLAYPYGISMVNDG